MVDLVYWIFAGIIATLAMSLLQLVQLGFYDKKTVPEFNQNAHLLSHTFGKKWDDVYWYGLILHIVHGVLGAMFFGILLEFNIVKSELIYGIGYGFFLWIILLMIHKPITNEKIFNPFPNVQLISSSISHLIYGSVLVIL